MLRIFFLFVTILFLGFYSCKIENKPVESDLKSAFNFQPGTYWIYKEALSGAIDSFYVSGSALTSGYGQHRSYTYDIIEEYIISERIDTPVLVKNGSWYLTMQLNEFNFHIDMEFMANAVNTDEYLNYYDFLAFPFSKYRDGKDSIDVAGTYQVNGNSFDNVWVAHFIDQPGTPSFTNDYFYLSKDVYMVRMVLNDSLQNIHKDYQLLRWHIQK